jgi:hypothetical protein
MAAPAEDDSGLVLLDLTEKQTPRLLRSGSFEDFGVEVYTGLSPRGRSVLVDGFRLRLPSSLMLDGPRPNVRVVSLILSPKRIEQLKELNRELANQDSEDNQPNETVLRAVNAENLQDFARRGTNPSRASRYFEIFREVPTLAGTTDQNGSLDWSVPLLRPSPKLEPGSWVAVCFGPADRT